jgi:hypothetical protein
VPKTRIIRVNNIPLSWEKEDLRQCLHEVVKGYGQKFRISAFCTSAIHSESRTALLVSTPLLSEQWNVVHSEISQMTRDGVSLRNHPDVRMHLDTYCTGLTTLYEPEPDKDLETEFVDTTVKFST